MLSVDETTDSGFSCSTARLVACAQITSVDSNMVVCALKSHPVVTNVESIAFAKQGDYFFLKILFLFLLVCLFRISLFIHVVRRT